MPTRATPLDNLSDEIERFIGKPTDVGCLGLDARIVEALRSPRLLPSDLRHDFEQFRGDLSAAFDDYKASLLPPVRLPSDPPSGIRVVPDRVADCADEAKRLKRRLDATVVERPRKPKTSQMPHWDPLRRELSIGGKPVKRYLQPAKSQTAVLSTFEEDHWAVRIDAPVPARRIDDTLRKMNAWANRAGLVFERDGTGEGILWKRR